MLSLFFVSVLSDTESLLVLMPIFLATVCIDTGISFANPLFINSFLSIGLVVPPPPTFLANPPAEPYCDNADMPANSLLVPVPPTNPPSAKPSVLLPVPELPNKPPNIVPPCCPFLPSAIKLAASAAAVDINFTAVVAGPNPSLIT